MQPQNEQTPPAQQPGGIAEDTAFQTLIPTKNTPALLAYYTGVFGLIPGMVPLSIAAIILGVSGLKQAKANPTPGAKGHAVTGIVLGCIELAILALVIMLIVFAAAQ